MGYNKGRAATLHAPPRPPDYDDKMSIHSHLRSDSAPRAAVDTWRGMSRENNMTAAAAWRWGNMLIAFIAALILLAATPGARGQALDEAVARQAFAVAENWVRRASVSDQTVTLLATEVRAVHVTPRRGGVTIGQATAAIDNVVPDSPLGLIDLCDQVLARWKFALWLLAGLLRLRARRLGFGRIGSDRCDQFGKLEIIGAEIYVLGIKAEYDCAQE